MTMNKKILLLLLGITIVFIGVSSCKDALSPEKLEVIKVYNAYTKALIQRKGNEAVKYITHEDIEYYNKILDIAVHGTRSKIHDLNTFDKITVIYMRLSNTKKELEQLNGRTFFVKAVDEGRVGKDTNLVKAFSIKDVEIERGLNINGDSLIYAYIKGVINEPNAFGVYPKHRAYMRYENKRWKYSQTYNINSVNDDLSRTISLSKPNGMSEEDFIVDALSRQYNINKPNILDNY